MRKTRFTATQRRCYVCGEPPGAQRRSIHAPMSLPDGQYSPSAIHGVDELPCSRDAWLEPERTWPNDRLCTVMGRELAVRAAQLTVMVTEP